MRFFWAFLYRNRVFLLFLILQAIAISLIFRSRSFQRASILNSSSAVTGSILDRYNSYLRYLDLDKQNQRLSEENARLRSLVRENYLPITGQTMEQVDTTYDIRYQFIEATVIHSSFLKSRNFITIDRGSVHGIQPEMGVIGPEGAVGIVQKVGKHFATVLPLINPGISISGKFADKGFFGPVQWKENDYRYITLSDIPRYAQIKTGDSVLTDQRSRTFPPGIMIGTKAKLVP